MDYITLLIGTNMSETMIYRLPQPVSLNSVSGLPTGHARAIAACADRVCTEGRLVSINRGECPPRPGVSGVKNTTLPPVQTSPNGKGGI